MSARALIAVVGMVREARIAERAGLSPAIGTQALLEDLAARAAGVVSFGLAGGLDPSLRVGDLLIASEIVSGGRRLRTDPFWTAQLTDALPHARRAVLAGSDSIVADAAAKGALRAESGADAVDTESHHAAAFALRWRLPFAAVRAVCDPFDRSLPEAACVGLRPDGRSDLNAVLRSVFRRPAQFPALFGLAFDAERAFRVLDSSAPIIAALAL